MNPQDDLIEQTIDGIMARLDYTLEKYTDFVSCNHNAACWAFDSEVLDKPGQPVKRALFQGLRELSQSVDTSLHDQHFTVFMGDNGFSYYYLAVAPVSQSLIAFLNRYLTAVDGFALLEYKRISALPVIPRFRYEAGQVIEYAEADLAGTWRDDDDEWFGSGLRVVYRHALPASLLGRESFGGMEGEV